MNWIAITKAELYEAKVAALIDACDSAALGDNQAERSVGIIQGVVNEVRNAVASCDSNQVDSNPSTTPANLRDLVVDLVIARLKNTLELPLTEDERSNVSWRRKQLDQIAAGDLVVDQPDNAVTPAVQGGGSIHLISTSTSRPTADNMRGL